MSKDKPTYNDLLMVDYNKYKEMCINNDPHTCTTNMIILVILILLIWLFIYFSALNYTLGNLNGLPGSDALWIFIVAGLGLNSPLLLFLGVLGVFLFKR